MIPPPTTPTKAGASADDGGYVPYEATPADAYDALILLAPREELDPREVESARRLLARGGSLLLALGPRAANSTVELAKGFGLNLDTPGREVHDFSSPRSSADGRSFSSDAFAGFAAGRGVAPAAAQGGARGVRPSRGHLHDVPEHLHIEGRVRAGRLGTLLRARPRALPLIRPEQVFDLGAHEGLARHRRAVELLHLPADEAAEEQDGVELEQLLHVEQLVLVPACMQS